MKKFLKLFIMAVSILILSKTPAYAGDGSFAGYNGLARNEYGWWKVENGKVNFDYTGLARNENGWFYVSGGKVNFNYTGLAKNENGWFYVSGGKVNFNYAGLAKNQYGWFYVSGGKVNFDYTGLARNENGWFYVSGGKVNFDYTGLAKNQYGWFYVSGGKVNFDYTGLAKNQYGWFYVSGGKVNFNYTGLAKNQYGWWRVESGKVDFAYTGLAKNENGWFYLHGGKVDFSYTGPASNENGEFFVKNGNIKFGYSGYSKGNNTVYIVENGKVIRSIYSNVDPAKPMIALTYDDGPYSLVTSRILDALEAVGGRATFFNVGNRIGSYQGVAKRAVQIGCSISNHTWDHTSLTSLGSSSIVSEITGCDNAIKNYTGETSLLVRPVGGAVNATVKASVDAPLILWSVDTLDWKNRNASSVYSKVIGHVQDGDIVLMHDLYTSTAEASEKMIPELVREGYQLVTVEELAYYKGYTLKDGQTYTCFR
ncbi:MAG: polysaccharide deacetylase family protein [Agathobacter sp.]|nr:polysaccharide deacetylase family protein [Agathobacter sp.]